MFPCTGCGLCCQNITNIVELKEYDLGSGICKHFNLTDSSCNIYDDRPDICKIDKMFDIEYHKYFTKEEFYVENANACNRMQIQCNMNINFKVIIGE